MTGATILWRRLDVPGHESARVYSHEGKSILTGTAIFLHEAIPCRLNYSITCSPNWETEFASVQGWIGQDDIEVVIRVDGTRRWLLNGTGVPEVEGCIDLDLNFSPSTNLLPLRRLRPQVGESVELTAAWLRFPSFRLEPLPQAYHRITKRMYRYESRGGSFVSDLTVNESCFVTHYPGFFSPEEGKKLLGK